MQRNQVLMVVALCTGSACAENATTDRGNSRVSDSAGVSIAVGPQVDMPLPWSLTELRRLGGADSGVLSFTRVGPATVSTDGKSRIAVLDWDNGNRIHVFDSAGTLLHSVGGKGGGPGEMQGPQGVAMGADGSLLVHDYMKSALLRWDARGQVMGETKLASGMITSSPYADGDRVFAGRESGDTLTRTRRLDRWTSTDTVSIDSTVTPRPKMAMFSCVGIALPPLFSGELTWAIRDNVVATSKQSHYVIDVRENDRLVRSIRRDITSAPATLDDVSKLYPEGFKVRFGGGRECVVPTKEVGEKVGLASHLPVVRSLKYAPDGSLWVERYTFEGETPFTDVFDARGEYLGTLEGQSLPLGFLGPDVVLLSIKNPDDGTSVIGIFRIQRTAPKS